MLLKRKLKKDRDISEKRFFKDSFLEAAIIFLIIVSYSAVMIMYVLNHINGRLLLQRNELAGISSEIEKKIDSVLYKIDSFRIIAADYGKKDHTLEKTAAGCFMNDTGVSEIYIYDILSKNTASCLNMCGNLPFSIVSEFTESSASVKTSVSKIFNINGNHFVFVYGYIDDRRVIVVEMNVEEISGFVLPVSRYYSVYDTENTKNTQMDEYLSKRGLKKSIFENGYVLSLSKKIGEWDWYTVSEMNLAELCLEAKKPVLLSIFILVFSLLLLHLAVRRTAGRVNAVMKSFFLVLDELGKGNYDYRIPVPNNDGHAGIKISFNEMTDQLMKIFEDLKLSRTRYKYFFDNVGVALLEEDYSEIYKKFKKLRKDGVKNIRGFFESNPSILKEMAASIRIVDVNDEAVRLFRANSKKDLLDSVDILFNEVSYDQFMEHLIRLYNGMHFYSIENVNRTFDGNQINVLFSISFPESVEEAKTVLISLMDISEQKEMERYLEEEKEKFVVTLSSIADGVIVTDIYGNVILLNEETERILGYTKKELFGKKIFNFIDVYRSSDGERENLWKRIQKNLTKTTDLILKDKHGNFKNISEVVSVIRDHSGVAIGHVFVFRDITEHVKIERETRNFQKIESIGILAGGIAHDFNNLLTAILGNISLCKMEADPSSEVFSMLKDAESASLRAQNLTQQLLTFSKGGDPVKKPVSVKKIITESISLVLTGSNVRAETEFYDEDLFIYADEGQISQVFNNIIINAKQAMPQGGILKIRCFPANLDGAVSGKRHEAGNFVKIRFSDEGPGIPDEITDRIFDPFFTTKQMGSGLGLATSQSIITQHDGVIEFRNTEKGAEFMIFLPSVSENFVPDEKENNIVQGKGSILLLDDEEIIRNITSKMVTYLGYTIELAETGETAVQMYKQSVESGRKYDVVILDLTIPGGIGGKDVMQQLLEIDPEVKGIVSSGYSNDPVMSNYKEYGFSEVIKKPFTLEILSKVLDDITGMK